jgi:hypothetical protein
MWRAVALCEARASEIPDPGWSDRQGQLVKGRHHQRIEDVWAVVLMRFS